MNLEEYRGLRWWQQVGLAGSSAMKEEVLVGRERRSAPASQQVYIAKPASATVCIGKRDRFCTTLRRGKHQHISLS